MIVVMQSANDIGPTRNAISLLKFQRGLKSRGWPGDWSTYAIDNNNHYSMKLYIYAWSYIHAKYIYIYKNLYIHTHVKGRKVRPLASEWGSIDLLFAAVCDGSQAEASSRVEPWHRPQQSKMWTRLRVPIKRKKVIDLSLLCLVKW